MTNHSFFWWNLGCFLQPFWSYSGQIKCRECSWFGHMGKNCRHKGMKRKNEDLHEDKSKKKKEQTHETQEGSKPKENAAFSMQEPEGIAFIEEVTFENTKDNVENHNYDTYNSDVYENDELFPIITGLLIQQSPRM